MHVYVWCNTSHSILDVVNTGGGPNRGYDWRFFKCESEIAPVKYLLGTLSSYTPCHIAKGNFTPKEVRHNPPSQKQSP
jgi:hypothetical protein